ncbi:hypothetical protein Sp245p_23870 (plasmid) [Azospirillum baldaniorum]|uniref:Uncharacterized protein n=1 Tax=Azospirillum baldaniorum TaxID=1064539 RepID=A0A9P1NRF3_9PROT|nr:hypothetical protein Sp245p_23870 [Azospirillum baldaniorum]CCD02563.1 protein of unknown function [Azospirillum baldaniorum]
MRRRMIGAWRIQVHYRVTFPGTATARLGMAPFRQDPRLKALRRRRNMVPTSPLRARNLQPTVLPDEDTARPPPAPRPDPPASHARHR